jgi:fibronectin type 3 domain-containing protein
MNVYKDGKRQGRVLITAFALVLAGLCAGTLAGCKDLFHPEGPDDDYYYPYPVLSPPSSVSAYVQSSSSITVSWSSVSGATSYSLSRSSNGSSFGFITNTSSTSYTDTGLSSNTTYSYAVCTLYDNDRLVSPSTYVSATTWGTVPSTPSSVTASAQSSSSITVSWGSVSGASDYYIYRATSSGGTYSQITSTSSTSYTNTGLSSNTTYYYRVSAVNNYGESSQSSYASATTTTSGAVPSTPSSVTASAQSSTSITVSWGSVSGASYYYVYRATSSNGSYSYIGSTYSTSLTDTGLSSNTTYYYRVSAWNSYGESSQSNYASATTNSSSSSTVTLTNNQWYTNSFTSSSQTHTYQFFASAGTTYRIQWDDSYNGSSSSYNVDVRVSASGAEIASFSEDSGYTTPKAVTASSSGYITITVTPWSSGDTGNYRIRYYW